MGTWSSVPEVPAKAGVSRLLPTFANFAILQAGPGFGRWADGYLQDRYVDGSGLGR